MNASPSADSQRFLQLLDERHEWPSVYAFKFIVPEDKGAELQALIPEASRVETRASREGRYVAYTFHCPMGSGREVLDVYARVQGIKGLLSL